MSLAARFIGLDRDRAFYPTILMVIASYDILFAVMGGSMRVLVVETLTATAFFAAAAAGFRFSLWLVVEEELVRPLVGIGNRMTVQVSDERRRTA